MALTPAEKQRAYRERLKQRALGQLPKAPVPCNIPASKRWASLIDQAREEMQQYHDDRSEEWQESERGEQFAEQIEALEAVLEFLRNK